jgi:hypothetical protein
MHAKSRAWVARRNGQQQQQRMSQQGAASAADAFAQSPFKGLSSAMGDGAAAAADAAGSFMGGLPGKGGAGELPVLPMLLPLRAHASMSDAKVV